MQKTYLIKKGIVEIKHHFSDLSFETHCSGNATTALSRLQEKFLCNLEYEERPVKNKSTLTEIEIGFFPVYITVVSKQNFFFIINF